MNRKITGYYGGSEQIAARHMLLALSHPLSIRIYIRSPSIFVFCVFCVFCADRVSTHCVDVNSGEI